ncbi:aldo/keto reductase [Gemmatimonas sp. UBA7669]|uniref:aldo/keto reductase n=1 Tax=Gemmatimonas sp. UBA7669 TaxID=1946568 RepID=UPI0025BF074A|nr:aldo/keto reductase [Gemmatimonas sp. UBA7669]
MISRRDFLATTAGVGATLSLTPRLLDALAQGQLIQRAIPSTGEKIPVIGLGSSATFSSVARSEDVTALREVFKAMTDRGASVFDTAPSYGASEEVAGKLVNEMGIANKMFWATKLNVAGRGGGTADVAAAKAQVEQSFARFKRAKIDLIQVHNMADPPTQLGVLQEYKKAGKVRYVGITTTSDSQYGLLESVMRNEPLDFIGIDYAADNRGVEDKILPLAQERKIGVLVYAPFGRTSLFSRAANTPVPEFAKEFGAATYAQFFLKFILAHPAVTAITPATSKATNMIDNIGGGIGKLPTAAQREQIIKFVDALPPARR